MSEEEEITDEKESTMETADDELEYNDKSPDCPHYERDTCLILFKCCNEWYPCHKCHNEAMTSLAEQNGMETENSRPSHDNETVSMEIDDAEVASFSEAIDIRSGAEEAQQEDASTTDEEVDVNVVDETSNEQSNRTSGACNDENDVKAGTGSSYDMDATPFSSSGIKEKHSVSTAVDAIQAFGQLQENSEESIGSHFSVECEFSMVEQESDRLYLQGHLEGDDSMLEERDGLEMARSSEIKEMRNDSRGQQEDASTTGDEVDVNVIDGTSDDPSNRQTGACSDETGIKAGSESYVLQAAMDATPTGACSDETGIKAGSESYVLQAAMDATPFSPSGMEEKQSEPVRNKQICL